MSLVVAMLVSLVGVGSGGPVEVTARIDATKLRVGKKYDIVVEYKVSDGASTSDAGIPAPILQIEVPRSAKLSGKELTSYKALSQNEFLQTPFERMLKESPATIQFKLRKKPKDGEHFALNFIAYVGSGDDAEFVRQRLILPVAAGAEATTADATTSTWGKTDHLQIGDSAVDFTLPKADGSMVSLGAYAGKKNVIVTTYRAFW